MVSKSIPSSFEYWVVSFRANRNLAPQKNHTLQNKTDGSGEWRRRKNGESIIYHYFFSQKNVNRTAGNKKNKVISTSSTNRRQKASSSTGNKESNSELRELFWFFLNKALGGSCCGISTAVLQVSNFS